MVLTLLQYSLESHDSFEVGNKFHAIDTQGANVLGLDIERKYLFGASSRYRIDTHDGTLDTVSECERTEKQNQEGDQQKQQ